jgi:ankyrin repeat protein
MLEKAGAKTMPQVMAETSELVHAALYGDIELVNKAVGGASSEEKNIALTIAVGNNYAPLVKCLLAAGADPDTTRKDTSMLFVACKQGHTAVVKELINAGADITAMDFGEKTALQHAAKHKHRDIVALLLAKAKGLKSVNK